MSYTSQGEKKIRYLKYILQMCMSHTVFDVLFDRRFEMPRIYRGRRVT